MVVRAAKEEIRILCRPETTTTQPHSAKQRTRSAVSLHRGRMTPPFTQTASALPLDHTRTRARQFTGNYVSGTVVHPTKLFEHQSNSVTRASHKQTKQTDEWQAVGNPHRKAWRHVSTGLDSPQSQPEPEQGPTQRLCQPPCKLLWILAFGRAKLYTL